RSEPTGTRLPDRAAGPPSSSHPLRPARMPRTRSPTVAASHRNFLLNRLAAAHTRAWEDQCYPAHPDCSPDSSKQCPTAASGISMRFPLSSDTDRPLFRSAVGIPLPGWPHARSFSDLPFFDLAARRSARCSARFPQPPRSCQSPTSPPHPLTPHSAVPFQRGLPRAPGAVPPFPRAFAANRSASQQPPPATREPAPATREPSHSPTHATIPEKVAAFDSQVPARRRMRSTPSHLAASPIATSRTSESRSYSCRLLPLSALHSEFRVCTSSLDSWSAFREFATEQYPSQHRV